MTKPLFVETTLPELLGSVAEFKANGWRFAQCCAVAVAEGQFEVLYSFVDDATSGIASLRVSVTSANSVPSITDIYPNAFMFENEMHDLFGITVTGISLDYKGGFYHLHIPTPMALRATPAASPAATEQ